MSGSFKNSRKYWCATGINDTQRQFIASIVNTVSKFTAGVNDTGGHIFSRDLH
jgi:hypothetical protein